jgi:16S rRNA U1498 N3-methylase RsmE
LEVAGGEAYAEPHDFYPSPVKKNPVKISIQTVSDRLGYEAEETKFVDFMNQTSFPLNFAIAHCDDTNDKKEIKDFIQAKDTCILIGPEGDFTNDEVKMAIEKGATPLSLGKNRLRTETAGIIVCSAFSVINN